MTNYTNKSAILRFKKVVILVSAIFFLPGTARPQKFERAIGSMYEDCAQSVIPAWDGGYVMAGYTLNSASSPGNTYDILVVKTDVNGSVVWSRTIGSAVDDLAYWMEATADSTYLICGTMADNNNSLYDDFVIRLDTSGSILFQRNYAANHTESAFCVRETTDGGFIVAGETVLGGIDGQLHLFKTDSSGNVLWSKAYGDTEQQSASFVEQTDDNGYIVCGVSRFGLTWSSIYVVKTDSLGNVQWANKYNTQPYLSRCDASRIIETSDGGYIISGATSANLPLKSVVLMKVDSTGAVVWQNLYGTGRGERNTDIIYDSNGYVVCGSTASISGYDDLLLMKTDTLGNLIWNFSYGVQDSNTIGYSMLKSMDGKLVVAGSTDAYGAGNTDLFLLKSDSISDNSLCNMMIPEIVIDTVTLAAVPDFSSSIVAVTSSAGNFTSQSGIQEMLICSEPLSVLYTEPTVAYEASPNPFSEKTILMFTTKEATDVASLQFYDSFGREVRILKDENTSTVHRFHFSPIEDGIDLSSGIYHFIFSSGKYRSSGKIVFVECN